MDFQVSIRLTKELMEAVARRTFFHSGRWTLILLGFGALLTILCLWQGEISLLGVPDGLRCWISPYAYLKHMRQARKHVEKWGESDVVYHFTEEHLHIAASHGQEDIPWRIFEKLLRYKDFWLLFPNAINAYVLPADQMEQGPGEFLAAKVRENGGKVK